MAFMHKVKIIRESGIVTKKFQDYDYEKMDFNPRGQVADFVRNAIKMPKTVRVEIEETDTQLYGIPMSERSYPKAIVLKDGRIYKFHGKDSGVAFLQNENISRAEYI